MRPDPKRIKIFAAKQIERRFIGTPLVETGSKNQNVTTATPPPRLRRHRNHRRRRRIHDAAAVATAASTTGRSSFGRAMLDRQCAVAQFAPSWLQIAFCASSGVDMVTECEGGERPSSGPS